MGRARHRHHLAISADGEYVQAVFLTNCQVDHGVPDPAVGNSGFVDRVFRREANEIEDVIAAVAHGGPNGRLLFGIDHLVRATGKQKLGVCVAGDARQHEGRAPLFQKRSDFQRSLQIVAHCDDAQVELLHPERVDQRGVGGIADLGVCDVGHGLLYPALVLVDGEHLVVQVPQLLGHVASEPAQADQQYVFHGMPPAFFMEVIVSSGP